MKLTERPVWREAVIEAQVIDRSYGILGSYFRLRGIAALGLASALSILAMVLMVAIMSFGSNDQFDGASSSPDPAESFCKVHEQRGAHSTNLAFSTRSMALAWTLDVPGAGADCMFFSLEGRNYRNGQTSVPFCGGGGQADHALRWRDEQITAHTAVSASAPTSMASIARFCGAGEIDVEDSWGS